MENVSNLPVMPKCCKTCPFKANENGGWQNNDLAVTVIERNLFNSQQICHHPVTYGEEETHRCRGYFDYAKGVYEAMGWTVTEEQISNESEIEEFCRTLQRNNNP